MANFIIWIIASGIFLATFLILLIHGLKKKRKKHVSISIIFLIAGIICGSFAVYIAVAKVYGKVSANISNTFKPRSGIEIYTAIFGKPVENCVVVEEKMDQIVPRLDCCIWLKFRTCTAEIKRISTQFLLPPKRILSKDSFDVEYGPKPDWWAPQQLGDSIQVLENYDERDPNHDRILVISKDSTKALYCDMTD